jgi:hypothetical protein
MAVSLPCWGRLEQAGQLAARNPMETATTKLAAGRRQRGPQALRTPCSDLRRETSGTEGSNPPPSSSESGANRDAGEGVCAQRGTTRGFRQAGGDVVPQWSCQQVGRPRLLGGARSSGGRGVGELHGDIRRCKADFSGLPLGIDSGGLEEAGIIT